MISALGVILGLVPLIFIISILLTAIGYGTNRQEGYR
jgi:ABC-type transport system involved in multi-copper enzyme maturation permease subunit